MGKACDTNISVSLSLGIIKQQYKELERATDQKTKVSLTK